MSEKRILVIDDEPDVCRYLARLFQEHGYSAACATDGYAAADEVKHARPDLITLEPSMADKSGLKFYREMKTTPELSSVPIIFVTVSPWPAGSPRSAERAHGTGLPAPPDGYAAKPIDPDEILGLVGRLISARQAAASH